MAEKKICARCKRAWGELQIRKCPHEAVNRLLGEYICYWCCKKCKHHTTTKYCGAIGCALNDPRN